MFVKYIFNLNGRDILSAGNDDILASIFYLDVAVRIRHTQISRVEPSTFECLLGGFWILVVPFHYHVSLHENLPDGLSIFRDVLERLWIFHHKPFEHRIPDTLASIELGLILVALAFPVILLDTDGYRPVNFRETVDMRNIDSHVVHRLQDAGRRRRGGSHESNALLELPLLFLRGFEQHLHNDRRSAHMCHTVVRQSVVDALRSRLPETYVRPAIRRDRPREAPAVAVKHW
mmetsp:Transcript_18050/g.34226  ORF Transcript_18050/g.34226 Transcript_18050/m.34226 type:complete len:232 (+) Transcript_18050:365-1060(+)